MLCSKRACSRHFSASLLRCSRSCACAFARLALALWRAALDLDLLFLGIGLLVSDSASCVAISGLMAIKVPCALVALGGTMMSLSWTMSWTMRVRCSTLTPKPLTSLFNSCSCVLVLVAKPLNCRFVKVNFCWNLSSACWMASWMYF